MSKFQRKSEDENWFDEISKKCKALEKERDYSKAMLIDQIKKKKGISIRYGFLIKDLKTLKERIAELNRTMPLVEPTVEMVDWCDKLEQLTETNWIN